MFSLKTYDSNKKLEDADIKDAAKILSEIRFRGGFKSGNIELLEDFLEILHFFEMKNKEAENEMPPTEDDCIRLMQAQDFMLYAPTIEKEIIKIKGKL